MDEIPNSFILRFVTRSDLLLRQFAPGTFTDNATDLKTCFQLDYENIRWHTYIISDTEALCVVLHQDGVVQVEVENVTTFVCLSHFSA